MKKIKSSEITPEHLYLSRREFLKSMGIVAGTAALLAACAPDQLPAATTAPTADGLTMTDSSTATDAPADIQQQHCR